MYTERLINNIIIQGPQKFFFTADGNHPCIIQFDPQETSVLSLQFAPLSLPLTANVLVFINDDSDQIEECFLSNN